MTIEKTNLNNFYMKKSLLLLIMVLLLALTSFAQTEHMKFMGIPIDGSLKSNNGVLSLKLDP